MERHLGVVLIDDHSLFARGLQLLLPAASQGRVEVLAVCERSVMAVPTIRQAHPDVALVDLAMPPPDGIELIRELKRRIPQLRVIALSGIPGIEAPIAALCAGADGFLPKTADPDELAAPLLAMLEGWQVVPRELLQHLLTRSVRPGGALLDRLDGDERRLWRAVARGARNDELARELHLSERSVKRLVASLLRRIGASNRVEAAALAGACGLLEPCQDDGADPVSRPDGVMAWHPEASTGA